MIRLKNVAYTYPYQEGKAVDRISIDIAPGKAVLCTGMSGCGKSTLVRLINGLIPHHHQGTLEGSIRIAGINNQSRSIADIAMDVGTLLQDPEHQFLTLNVADELAFAHEWRGRPADDIQKAVSTSANAFSLNRLMQNDILTLSEGEKQKVALAAAVSMNPKVMVLDEPSANLDPQATLDLAKTLGQLKQAGMTLFIADHRLYWLKDIIDQVIIMSKGRIAAKGDFAALEADTVQDRFGLRSTRVRDMAQMLPTVDHIRRNGIKIEGLTFGYGSGDNLFDNDAIRLPKGEVIAVTGNNGVGKTTLARLITGLEKMTAGAVYMNGNPLAPKNMLKKGCIILQNTDHQLHMKTVSQELEICARSAGMTDVDSQATEMLAFFKLSHLAQRHPQSLSGGEKQRLVIACGMIRNPDILVLDEPTSGLDGTNMRLIARGIEKVANRGACVLVISHDLELISMVATARLHLPLA